MADRLKLSTALTLIIAHSNALVGRHEWLADNARAWFWLAEEAQCGRVVIYGDTSEGSRAIPPGYFYPGEPEYDLEHAAMWVYPPRQLPDQFAKPDHFIGAGKLGVPVGRIITGLLVDEVSLSAALERVSNVGAKSTEDTTGGGGGQKAKRGRKSKIDLLSFKRECHRLISEHGMPNPQLDPAWTQAKLERLMIAWTDEVLSESRVRELVREAMGSFSPEA